MRESDKRTIHRILSDDLPTVIADVDHACLAAVEKVAALFARWIEGDEPSEAEWKEASKHAGKVYGHGHFGEGREAVWIAKTAADGATALVIAEMAKRIGAS